MDRLNGKKCRALGRPGLLVLLLVIAGCDRCGGSSVKTEATSAVETSNQQKGSATGAGSSGGVVPLTVGMVPFDGARAELGRFLFHDGALSGDGSVSCASCHMPDHGGAEPRPVSVGIGQQKGPIQAPTVFNAVFNFRQFWDGRAADLKEQAAGPVTNPIEMGANWETVVATLQQSPSYPPRFAKAYGDTTVNRDRITDAIAEYEKSLITPSPFDDYLAGHESSISDLAQKGFRTFQSVGCVACHTGVNLGGTMFQKMGLVSDYFADRGQVTDADLGRFNVTKKDVDRHFFKVPTLRNVALTPPYFHDGSHQTLGDTVRTMGKYQLGATLKDSQVTEIVAFLESLTGEIPANASSPIPEEAPQTPAPTPR